MMAILLLISGLLAGPACTRKATTQKPTQTTTGSATTDSGPTPPWCTDCDGWNTWVDQVEAQFRATGKCPTEPPKMVAQPDGTMVAADPYVIDAANWLAWGRYVSYSDWTWVSVSVREGDNTDSCDDDAYPYGVPGLYFEDPEPGMVALTVGGSLHERITTPAFFRSILFENSNLDHFTSHVYYRTAGDFLSLPGSRGAVTLNAAYPPSGTYSWVCIESIETPSHFAVGPGAVHGSMFLHAAWWERPDGTWYQQKGPPTDIFVRLGAMDCTFPEDASFMGDDPPYYCEHWGSECDGLDNDMDGEIDEGQQGFATPWSGTDGALDDDGNGVPDCMDDWDGDGIPNTLDEDVNACCWDFDDDYCY